MALEATNALVAFSIMALADAVLVFATEAAVSTTADMTKFQTRASLGFDFGSMTVNDLSLVRGALGYLSERGNVSKPQRR